MQVTRTVEIGKIAQYAINHPQVQITYISLPIVQEPEFFGALAKEIPVEYKMTDFSFDNTRTHKGQPYVNARLDGKDRYFMYHSKITVRFVS